MSHRISIVIPCYNVERYLHRCLDSVLNNTDDNFVVIAVNDASTDNTLEILEEYHRKDRRVTIVNLLDNVGLGGARDAGLNFVESDYVMFIDSDDFIHPKTIEICNNLITENEPDLLEFSYSSVKNDELTKICEVCPKVIEGSSNILRTIDNIACNKVFKTGIIKINNLKFRYRLFEDTHFTMEFALHCSKVIKINVPLYNYFVNVNSLSHTYRPDYFSVMIDRTEEVWNLLNNAGFQCEANEFVEKSKLYLLNKLVSVRGNTNFQVKSKNSITNDMCELVNARNHSLLCLIATSLEFFSLKRIIKLIAKRVLNKI